MIPAVAAALLALQAHVAGRHVDVFGEKEAAEKAAREADAAADRFEQLFGSAPIRGAVVLTKKGRPARDAKQDMAYLQHGARWIWRWEPLCGTEPDETMTHELGHMWLIFWVHGPTPPALPFYGSSLPDWVDEGVASLLEGPEAHAQYSSLIRSWIGEKKPLKLAPLFDSIHPGSREESKRPRFEDRWVYYVQTWSVTAFLTEAYGPDAFHYVMISLREGKELGQILGTLGLPKTLADLETDWRAWAVKPPKAAAGTASKR